MSRPALLVLTCGLRALAALGGAWVATVVLGCPSTSSTSPDTRPAVAEASDGEDSEPDQPQQEPAKPAGPNLPTGPLCDSNADCSEGQVCEGVGCEAGQGRC